MNKNILLWFENLVRKLCKIKTKNFLKVLKLDFETVTRKDRNTANILLSDFISGVWFGYKNGVLADDPRLVTLIKGRIYRNRYILCKCYKSFKSYFTEAYLTYDDSNTIDLYCKYKNVYENYIVKVIL